jgi:lysophospholipase L1-like esterase
MQVLVATPASALLAVPPTKVMVVGDSISQGSAGDYTWRYRFSQHETTVAGVSVDLVGPRNDLYDNVADASNDNHTYADPNFDQDHDALWGRTLASAAGKIKDEVTRYQPSYLLVLLGIDDLAWGVSDPAGAEVSLRDFVANARSADPHLRFVVGTLLPTERASTDPAFAATVAEFNTRLGRTAADLSTPDSPMVTADTGTDFVPADDTWDGTHPNAKGEVKIAAAFADALATRFGDHGPGFGASYPRPYPTVPLGPRTAPALTATPGNSAAALTWSLSPGATGYFVYVKNVTAGETGFTKLPWPVPGPSWTAGLLVNGATYQFQLGTTKGKTEGVRSNTVSVTPGGPPPAAVTDLTAAPGDKQATLTWTLVDNTTGYYVRVKNVTAGETGFTELPWPVTGPSWTAGLLAAGTTYEFQLQSINGLVRGGLSNVASVTICGTGRAAAQSRVRRCAGQ